MLTAKINMSQFMANVATLFCNAANIADRVITNEIPTVADNLIVGSSINFYMNLLELMIELTRFVGKLRSDKSVRSAGTKSL